MSDKNRDAWEAIGNSLGYIGKPCEKCGRYRVEKYENGDLICEKCHWSTTKQKYEKWDF